MQVRGQPLPVKWYLVSALGALLLAFLLMALFETRPGDDPTIPGGVVATKDSHVDATSAPTSSTPASGSAPSPTPPSPSPSPKPKSAPSPTGPGPTLWSMLVPPGMVYGSSAVVAAGFLTGVGTLWVLRRRMR